MKKGCCFYATPPLDLSYHVVVLLQHSQTKCCISATSWILLYFRNTTRSSGSLNLIGPLPACQPLKVFEPLWTPWSLWASLIAFEPQWTSLKALKAFDAFEPFWNDRTHRNLIRDSLGFYVWVFPTLPLTALQYHCVLGNRTSMIDSTARGSPIVIVFTLYIHFGQLSTSKMASFIDHNI